MQDLSYSYGGGGYNNQVTFVQNLIDDGNNSHGKLEDVKYRQLAEKLKPKSGAFDKHAKNMFKD